MIYKYLQIPKIAKYLFPNSYFVTKNNEILITFDDSPNIKTTKNILKILNNYKIQALFFCNGASIQGNEYKELILEIAQNGHEIGSHSYNHINLQNLTYKQVYYQIQKNNLILEDILNKRIRYFRAPYGRFLNCSLMKILKDLKLVNVMWSLMSYDYLGDLKLTKKIIQQKIKSNSIVVFHDNNKTIDNIEEILKFFIEEIHKKELKIGDVKGCLK
jgi:peptidoglycan/xylan/chitin deacetylase (PgdA/CDA1 family)